MNHKVVMEKALKNQINVVKSRFAKLHRNEKSLATLIIAIILGTILFTIGARFGAVINTLIF